MGAVLLLATVQFTAFVDRAAPSIVAAPLMATFELSDARMGLLQGPAFAVVYATCMLAAVQFARRVDPFKLMATCVAVWTMGAVLFALAQDYSTLVAGRMLLGVGQAAFAPAALLILGSPGVTIGRARAMSIFTSGSAIGRSGALFAGGGLLMLIAGQTVLGLEPWRTTSLFLILPNLALIAGLICCGRGMAWPTDLGAGLGRAVRWIAGPGRKTLSLFVAGSGCVLLVQAAGAWMPTILHRGFEVPVGRAAVVVGAIVLVAAPAGHLSAGWMLGLRAAPRPGWTMISGLMIAGLGAVILSAATSLAALVAALSLIVAGGGVAAATSLIALQPLVPASLRRGVNALYLSTTSMIGVGVGPWLTGWLSDRHAGETSGVSFALIEVVAMVATVAIPLALLAGKHWSTTTSRPSA